VLLERPRPGADGGGEDLLEALGGGYCFDGFEILWAKLVRVVRRKGRREEVPSQS
jgi:hypothetical protein